MYRHTRLHKQSSRTSPHAMRKDAALSIVVQVLNIQASLLWMIQGPETSDKFGADCEGNDASSDKAVRTGEDLQPYKDLPTDALKADAKCDIQLRAVNEVSVQC